MKKEFLPANGANENNDRHSIAALKRSVPPPHPLNLVRLRLINEVNKGLRRKLTVVSAPAGYGKTTLVSQWASQAPVKVAWLSLDKNDNDPGIFFKNLIACLQTVHQNIGKEAFQMLQSEQKPSMEAVLKKTIGQIGMVLHDFVIVLDDYQLIEAASVHNMMAFFLDYLPPQMHIFIISESDPPYPLAPLRADEQLKEIRAPYLAFTLDETTVFFNDLMALKLAVGEISALITRCEAQPAALKYAALNLKHSPQTPADFIADFENDGRAPLYFLIENLLRRQPEDVIRFLRKSSILEYLCEPLCNAVCGTNESGHVLQELSSRGEFISPLDGEGYWYGIHPFLKEALLKQFTETTTEDGKDLHSRASLWFLQQGMRDPAFQHLLAAGNFEAAGQIIEQNAFEMLRNGELATVKNWLESLPENILQKRPMLAICQCWVLIITSRFEEVEPYLELALNAIGNAVQPEEIRGYVKAIREYLTERDI